MRIGTRVQRGVWDDTAQKTLPDGSITGTIISIDEGTNGDGDARTEGMTVRWDNGALEFFGNDENSPPCLWDLEDVTPRLFVNVYLHDCDEAGWWYDTFDPEPEQCKMADSESHAMVLEDEAQAWCDEENANRRSNISSVASEGRYEVCVEAWPAEHLPAYRPHYC
jgi:hypothetical protein